MYIKYRNPMITPGNTAAMNRSPTDSAIWSAIITNMIEGGIRMPNVPDAATTPEANVGAYFCSIMEGSDNTPSSTTDAPMMPVDAARMMPIMVTVIASPPRVLPNSRCIAVISFSATPLSSSIRPIKMNIGKATRTAFDMVA